MHINSPAPMASFVLPLMPVLYLWYLVMGLPCMLHPLSCKKSGSVALLANPIPLVANSQKNNSVESESGFVLSYANALSRSQKNTPPKKEPPTRESWGRGRGARVASPPEFACRAGDQGGVLAASRPPCLRTPPLRAKGEDGGCRPSVPCALRPMTLVKKSAKGEEGGCRPQAPCALPPEIPFFLWSHLWNYIRWQVHPYRFWAQLVPPLRGEGPPAITSKTSGSLGVKPRIGALPSGRDEPPKGKRSPRPSQSSQGTTGAPPPEGGRQPPAFASNTGALPAGRDGATCLDRSRGSHVISNRGPPAPPPIRGGKGSPCRRPKVP